MIGTKLAHYEVTAHLGSGGMGDVYQATDAKLGRSVAIKLLPEAFARDADRAARFEREARVLASLNHPNIAAIHGLEESGDRKFLVMELVPGDTLADRIERGPIPVEEALGIARQIAEALEAAHEKTVVHRDLKPANVKVTPDGKVKVLDFGLAKALENSPTNTALSNSPTMSAMATNAGVILGTAAYMSPEQAKGFAADSRSDVFSFGCVLYEMLSGRQPFQGETASEVLASILVREPEFNLLPPGLNPKIYELLRRCLDKNPKRRWQAVGDLRLELESAAADVYRKPDATDLAAVSREGRKRLAWSIAATALLVAVAMGTAAFLVRPSPPDAQEVRFLISVPPMPNPYQVSISPDGGHVAFVASVGGGATQLFVRRIDAVDALPLPGTEGALNPFWSPDSRSIGFSTVNALKRVDAIGGLPQVLSNLIGTGSAGSGGTWNRDGVIVFSSDNRLHRISAQGGVSPTPVTTLDASLDELIHLWPYFLPDGKHFLYLAYSADPGSRAIYVGELESDRRTRIMTAPSMPVFAPPGFLLFQREGALFAQQFDASSLISGEEPIRLAEGVPFELRTGRAAFSASANGTLVYRSGLASGNQLQFAWFDRAGKPLGNAGPPGNYSASFDLSPDGKQVLIRRATASGGGDLWVLDWELGTSRPVTFDQTVSVGGIWSQDGLRVTFARAGLKGRDLVEKNLSGIGEATTLLEGGATIPEAWSKDGRYLVYSLLPSIWALPTFGDRKPFPVAQAPGTQDEPWLSFDGKWLAYNSDESGTNQVYVVSFPEANQKRVVSTNGGVQPKWRQDGKELYYLDLEGKLMAVAIQTDGEITAGIPKELFPSGVGVEVDPLREQYAVTSNGQRFLILKPVSVYSPATPITAVVNWTEVLKRRVPTN